MSESAERPSREPKIYRYPIDECDVDDKANLADFRTKQSECLHLMNDDENAIVKQLGTALWAFNVFSSINEARRIENEAGARSSALNPTISEFIDNGFVLGATTAIRKLWEPRSTNEQRQVVSLRRIIDEVRKHADLFTRQNYVCHDGLPYDCEAVQSDRMRQQLEERAASGERWKVFRPETQGPTAWATSQLLHKSFDRISGSVDRARHDRIDTKVFDRLISHVESSGIEDVKTVSNKLLVHAGDRQSREVARNALDILTINKLKACFKALYEATAFLGSSVLGDSHPGGFPTAQFDVFENLEHPWCSADRLEIVSNAWESFASEVSGWDASMKFNVLDRQ